MNTRAYYGGGIAGEAERSPRCPVMMHFGEKDAHIPMSDVEKVRQAQPEVQVFVYDATATAKAKKRTLSFFAEHIG